MHSCNGSFLISSSSGGLNIEHAWYLNCSNLSGSKWFGFWMPFKNQFLFQLWIAKTWQTELGLPELFYINIIFSKKWSKIAKISVLKWCHYYITQHSQSRLLNTMYSGDLKSDHLKDEFQKVRFSNGRASAVAIAIVPTIEKRTIQNPDIFVRISNGFRQNGNPLSGFQMVGLLDFRFHSKSGP